MLAPAEGAIKVPMKNTTIVLAGAALAAALGVTGCGLVTRPVPDEFTVVTKAPLVVPPDYGLRPPAPGAPSVQNLAPAAQAQAALSPAAPAARPATPGAPTVGGVGLLGAAPAAPAAAPVAGARTAGEQALLTRAKAVNPDPNIRAVIDLEVARTADRDNTFIRRLLFWQHDKEATINPGAEAARLRTADNAPKVVVAPPTAKREGGIAF